jgi:type VI secretion system protein ImpF
MARARDQIRRELSLLDRLIDLTPNSTAEAPLSSWEYAREMKSSVLRDLSSLLNTRRAEEDFDPEFDQATNSLLTFGITDFTAADLNDDLDREQVRCSIERAIRKFEPRLAQVKVMLQEPDPLQPTLRFQIDALLRLTNGTEPVLFDATLHRDSRQIALKGTV